MEQTKLIKLTDLSGKDRYYFCFETDSEVKQQEINQFEYYELKQAEERHFIESVNRIKVKYNYE